VLLARGIAELERRVQVVADGLWTVKVKVKFTSSPSSMMPSPSASTKVTALQTSSPSEHCSPTSSSPGTEFGPLKMNAWLSFIQLCAQPNGP
jgi:hypothetical protein